MAQLAIGLICTFFGVSILGILFNLYVRWPNQLRNYEKLQEKDVVEGMRIRHKKVKSIYTSIKPGIPAFWVVAIGLLLQGIYSLVTGLLALVK